jgi:hypothetical protein
MLGLLCPIIALTVRTEAPLDKRVEQNRCRISYEMIVLLWLQERLRNFTLQPIDPMDTSLIPSRLEAPPGLDDSRIYTTELYLLSLGSNKG